MFGSFMKKTDDDSQD